MPTNKKLQVEVGFKDKLTQGLKKVSTNLEKFESQFEKLSIAAGASFAILAFGINKVTKEAAQFQQVEESYDRMTRQMGFSNDRLLKSLNEASAGTVSNYNLMLSSNRAMALGVGDNMEDITTLMEIARLKGRALGLDTTQAFNDIVTGIGRGSPLILDNLGIMIKLGEAQEIYAKQLGKTVQQLSDAEKKNAIFNAVIKSGRKELEEVGDITLTTAEQMQQLRKEFEDSSAQIGGALLPAVIALQKAITPIIKNIGDWVEEHPKLTANIALTVTGLTGLAFAIGTAGYAIVKVTKFLKLANKALIVLRATALTAAAPFIALGAAVTAAGLVLSYFARHSQDKAIKGYEKLGEEADKARQKLLDSRKGVTKVAEEIEKLGTVSKETADKISKLEKEISKTIGDNAKKQAVFKEDLAQTIVEQEQNVADLTKQIKEKELEASKTAINSSAQEELSILKSKLSEEMTALESVKQQKFGIQTELTEMRRRAELTDFELRVENLLRQKVENLKAFKEKLQLQVTELNSLRTLRDSEIAIEKTHTENLNKENEKRAESVARMVEKINFTMSLLKPVSGGFGTAGMVTPAVSAFSPFQSGGTTINVTGNTVLDENGAEKIGDMFLDIAKTNMRFDQ